MFIAEVARGLGIHENLLHNWKRQYTEYPSGSFPGKGRLKPQDEEFRRLRKENTELRMERDILKKGVGHLLKTPEMKYRFIDRYSSAYGVERMC